jgi:NAD(P)H-hydrate epimerase
MQASRLRNLSLRKCQSYLLPRAKSAHKGNFGHVLVVGGDYGTGGACRLAGEAALRSGAGLVSIATRLEHAFAIMSACPELMCWGITKAADLDPLLKRATVVAIGPGLGQKTWGKQLLNHVLRTALPLVVDADGLNQLALKPKARKNWVLTPHVAEAARLLQCAVAEIQNNRINAIQQLQARYQGVAILKGTGTLVVNEFGQVQRCTAGNPAMATAGMGDLLTGIIAALVAQGLSLQEAAKLGVCAHATAADKLVEATHISRGLVARDLLNGIQECLNP